MPELYYKVFAVLCFIGFFVFPIVGIFITGYNPDKYYSYSGKKPRSPLAYYLFATGLLCWILMWVFRSQFSSW